MFRVMLSSRSIVIGLVFFVLIVGSSLLYSWHVRRTSESDMERHDRFLRGLQTLGKTRPAENVDVPTDSEPPGFVNTPDENTDTPLSDEIEVLPNETKSIDIANAFLPDDFVSEEAAAEDVPVSPLGFGPYPEVPADYPEHLTPIWVRNPNLVGVPGHAAEPFELMDRVLIKLWKQGHNIKGASTDNGKIYPYYPNVVYVRYKEFKRSDGTVYRRITRVKGGPNVGSVAEQIRSGNTPSHIQLVEIKNGGIDPYTFLNIGDK